MHDHNVDSPQEMVAWFYDRRIRVAPVESDYAISTTAVLLGKNQRPRLGYTLSNTGSTSIAIAYNQGVTITTGFLLLPGGTLNSSWYYDLEIVGYQIWAIGSAGGGTLHMLEQILTGL
jgi:hypothetical protein